MPGGGVMGLGGLDGRWSAGRDGALRWDGMQWLLIGWLCDGTGWYVLCVRVVGDAVGVECAEVEPSGFGHAAVSLGTRGPRLAR